MHTSDGAEPPRRKPELQDWLNRRLYHPLSWRVAQALRSTSVSPDAVSVAGAAAIVLAAAAYGSQTWPLGVALGLLLHMSWHVLDGADGDLARMRGQASPHGELVDGICDYAGHIVLYVVMGSIAAAQIGAGGWWLMGAAGASRIAQAAHYEGTRRQYQLAAYGTGWLGNARPPGDRSGRGHPLAAFYVGLTGLIVPRTAALIAAASGERTVPRLRAETRARVGALLGSSGILSANYRTLAVGAAMLAQRPQWYFLFEITILNVVLVISYLRVRRVFGEVLAEVAAEAPSSTRR